MPKDPKRITKSFDEDDENDDEDDVEELERKIRYMIVIVIYKLCLTHFCPVKKVKIDIIVYFIIFSSDI